MERVWASRLRWRLRGAWLAPLVLVLTLADAVLLHRLPISGDGPSLVGGLLLAGFFNLLAVAALAPLAGWVVRRRRPDLPAIVARDYAGVALVLLVTAALVGLGLAHRGELRRNHAAMADALVRGQAYIGARAPAEFRAHVEYADAIAIVEGTMYRVCAPDAGFERAWCVVVEPAVPFPGGVRFAGGTPNRLLRAGG